MRLDSNLEMFMLNRGECPVEQERKKSEGYCRYVQSKRNLFGDVAQRPNRSFVYAFF